MGSSFISPWDALMQTAQFARSLENAAPHREPSESSWQALSVVLGKDNFLTPLTDIKEILLVPKIAKIQSRQKGMQGVGMYRGEIMIMMDVSEILNHQPCRITKQTRMLMYTLEEAPVGCLIDKILGLEQIPVSDLQWDNKSSVKPEYHPYTLGIYQLKKKITPVISLKSMMTQACLALDGESERI